MNHHPAGNQHSRVIGSRTYVTERRQFARRGSTTTTTPLISGCKELCPRIFFDGSNWRISVSDGLLGNITPSIGEDLLSDLPQPLLTASAPGALYLKVTYTMDSSSYQDDGSTKYYRSETNGTVNTVEFVYLTTPPTDTQPDVNETTGVSTAGVSYVTWLTVLSDGGGGLKAGSSRKCNRMYYFCGTLKMYQS